MLCELAFQNFFF